MAQDRRDRKEVISEAACVCILFLDPFADIIVQQPIKDVSCLADRGRNGLRCKRRKLVRNMRVGFQPRLISVFGIDQIHRLALSGGWKELIVAGCGYPMPQNCAIGSLA